MYNASQKCASNGHWAARIVPGKVEVANEKFMARVELEKDFTLIGGKHVDLEAKGPNVEFVFDKYKSDKEAYRAVSISGRAVFGRYERRKQRHYRIEYVPEEKGESIFVSDHYSEMIEAFGGTVFGKGAADPLFVVVEEEVVFAVMPTNEGESS
jgi:hypothetical protein